MDIILPKSIKEAVKKCPLIIGIGPSAWPRIISGYFFPKFKILCFNDCQDNELIRSAGIEVFSQKEVDPSLELSPVTPGNIISTDIAKKYLEGIGEPFVFLVYKSMGKLEKVCEENGWKFMGSTMEVKDKYENKKIFKSIVKELGLNAIPGDNMPIGSLTEEVINKYQRDFGQKKLVLQIAEATWGGGSGTFFIEDKKDVTKFHTRVEEIRDILESKKKKMETVNIAPFIEGLSCSIPCCATKYGTFTGSLQTQIVDIDEVGAKLLSRSGVFVGHDWTFGKFAEDIQKQATYIGRKFGDYIYSKGYKGIFGLDLIVDNKGKVWSVECNPRETDAFPLICMLQMEKGLTPMQVFHNLEHLGVNYEIDFEKVDESYKADYSASQILIYNKSSEYVIDRVALQAGVYRLKGDDLEFVRPGFAIWDLKDENEFLVTEDISKIPGTIYDPHERMLRLVKKGGVLETESKLKREAAKAVEVIYKKLRLVPIEIGLADKRGLRVLFVKKLVDAKKSPDLEKADIVNVVKNTGSGFYRPVSISWRKNINLDMQILEQIPSKRARKQIRSDMGKIRNLGIEIKIFDEIADGDFDKWQNLYRKIIESKERGEVMIDKKWLGEKKKKGKKIGAILAVKDGEIIGGDLFFEVNGRLGVGYGVAERIGGLAGGLTLLLDYFFLEYAKNHGYQEVSFGQDTNLYGYDLSTGLISYKFKLGFHPVPANKTYWVSTYFQNISKFAGGASFFTGDGNELKLIEIKDNNSRVKI